jgi:hypothetical protein
MLYFPQIPAPKAKSANLHFALPLKAVVHQCCLGDILSRNPICTYEIKVVK